MSSSCSCAHTAPVVPPAPTSDATPVAISCDMTIQEVLAAVPASLPIFAAYGLDTCCGAHQRVEVAAGLVGADSFALCRELSRAAAGQSP